MKNKRHIHGGETLAQNELTRSGANRAGQEELFSERNSIPLAKKHHCDRSAAAQRARLLDALRCRPVSTIDARRNLDVMHPAMRVRELRLAGHPIETVWIEQATDAGRLHRVAQYILTCGGGA